MALVGLFNRVVTSAADDTLAGSTRQGLTPHQITWQLARINISTRIKITT